MQSWISLTTAIGDLLVLATTVINLATARAEAQKSRRRRRRRRHNSAVER